MMADVASVVTSQVDLLWSAALAIVVAEIFLICRFLADRISELRRYSQALLFASVFGFLISMLFGYFTYGATVEMVRRSVDDASAMEAFETAQIMALIQFGAFAIGLLCLVVAFILNMRIIGRAIDDVRRS